MIPILTIIFPLCFLFLLLTIVGSVMSYYYYNRRKRRKPYADFNEECARLGADMRRKSQQIDLAALEEKQKIKILTPKEFPQNTLHPNYALGGAPSPRDRRNTLHQFLNIPQHQTSLPTKDEDDISSTSTASNSTLNAVSPTRAPTKSMNRSARVSPIRRFSALPSIGQHLLPSSSQKPSQANDDNWNTETYKRRQSNVVTERFSIAEPFLDPRMYRFGALDPSHASLNRYRSGKLCFSLRFDPENHRLHVTVHKAHYLPSHSPKQTSCYYVKVTLLPDEHVTHKTTLVSTNSNPIFEQTFVFILNPPTPSKSEDGAEVGGEENTLQFTVKEAQHLEKNRIIGFVWIKLQKNLLETTSLESLWRDIVSPSKACDGASAEVLVNMRYISGTKTLTVQMEEAKNLPIRQQDVSVYCRISLMTEERVLRSKRTPSVKEDLVNPSMQNASVSFHVEQYLNQKTSDVRGVSSTTTDDLCIVVYICSRSGMGFSHLIGKTVIGPMRFTDGEGVQHWSEVWEKPDLNILRWHLLN